MIALSKFFLFLFHSSCALVWIRRFQSAVEYSMFIVNNWFQALTFLWQIHLTFTDFSHTEFRFVSDTKIVACLFQCELCGKHMPYCLHGKSFGLYFKDKYSLPSTFSVHIKVKLKNFCPNSLCFVTWFTRVVSKTTVYWLFVYWL